MQVWPLIKDNVTWVIKNGHSVRFWKDSWIPGVGRLEDHVQGSIPLEEGEFSVSSYVIDLGWQWDRFTNLLPTHICGKIASLCPPSLGEDDFPCWNLTTNGLFSLSSAYQALSKDNVNGENQNPLFKEIWHWKGPQRVRTFLWRLVHGRLLTNEERFQRRMKNDSLCPRCLLNEESIMHLLRDCDDVRDFWSQVVNEDNWSRSFSLGLSAWLEWNIYDNIMGYQVHGDWPIFFGVAV